MTAAAPEAGSICSPAAERLSSSGPQGHQLLLHGALSRARFSSHTLGLINPHRRTSLKEVLSHTCRTEQAPWQPACTGQLWLTEGVVIMWRHQQAAWPHLHDERLNLHNLFCTHAVSARHHLQQGKCPHHRPDRKGRKLVVTLTQDILQPPPCEHQRTASSTTPAPPGRRPGRVPSGTGAAQSSGPAPRTPPCPSAAHQPGWMPAHTIVDRHVNSSQPTPKETFIAGMATGKPNTVASQPAWYVRRGMRRSMRQLRNQRACLARSL